MTYEDRPWLVQYNAGMPSDIAIEFETALDMFRAAVERRPDLPLIRYFGRDLTAAEVDRITDALAAGLVADGFQTGDRLAVYLQNVPQFVLAMVATWKAGGIMVSINPMNKARELEYLLKDSGTSVLVCLESLYEETAKGVIAGGTTSVRSVITTNELDYVGADEGVPRGAGIVGQEPSGRHRRPRRAGRRPRRRDARAPPAHGRRRRVPHVHVGHDRTAQGCDEHAPQRRVQLAGLSRLDVAHARRHGAGRSRRCSTSPD